MLEATWDFETLPFAAMRNRFVEGKLIKEYRPRYNVSFRDDKRFPRRQGRYVGGMAPVSAGRFKKDDGSRYFALRMRCAAANLNFMRKKFGCLTFTGRAHRAGETSPINAGALERN